MIRSFRLIFFILLLAGNCEAFVPKIRPEFVGFPSLFNSAATDYNNDSVVRTAWGPNHGSLVFAFGDAQGVFQHTVEFPLDPPAESEYYYWFNVQLLEDGLLVQILVRGPGPIGQGDAPVRNDFYRLSADATEIIWSRTIPGSEGSVLKMQASESRFAFTKSRREGNRFIGEVEVRNTSDGSLINRYNSPTDPIPRSTYFGDQLLWNGDQLVIFHDYRGRKPSGYSYLYYLDFSINSVMHEVSLPNEVEDPISGFVRASHRNGRLYVFTSDGILNLNPLDTSDFSIFPVPTIPNIAFPSFHSLSEDWLRYSGDNILSTFSLQTGKLVTQEAIFDWELNSPGFRSADSPEVRVEKVTGGETEQELKVTLSVDRPLSHDLILQLQAEDGSAENGSDFLLPDQTRVVIQAGRESTDVFIPVIEDQEVEASEYFHLKWTSPHPLSGKTSGWLIRIQGSPLEALSPVPDPISLPGGFAANLYQDVTGSAIHFKTPYQRPPFGTNFQRVTFNDLVTGSEYWTLDSDLEIFSFSQSNVLVDGDYVAVVLPEPSITESPDRRGVVEIYSLSEKRLLHSLKNPQVPASSRSGDSFGRFTQIEAPYILSSSKNIPEYQYDVFDLRSGEHLEGYAFDSHRVSATLSKGHLIFIDAQDSSSKINPENTITNLASESGPVVLNPSPTYVLGTAKGKGVTVLGDDLFILATSGRVVARYNTQTGKLIELLPIPLKAHSFNSLGSTEDGLIGINNPKYSPGITSELLRLDPQSLQIRDTVLLDFRIGDFNSNIFQYQENDRALAMQTNGSPLLVVDLQPEIPLLQLFDGALWESAARPALLCEISETSNSAIPVKVELSGGTATAGKDYHPSSDFEIPPFSKLVKIPIPLIDDISFEDDETVEVRLLHQGREIAGAQVTIVSDDRAIEASGHITANVGTGPSSLIAATDFPTSENQLLAGQPLFPSNGITPGRAVLVNPVNGSVEQVLNSPEPRDGALFGAAVVETTKYYIVGEPGGPGTSQEGRVYVFDKRTGLVVSTLSQGAGHSVFGGILRANDTHLFVADIGSYTEFQPGRVFSYLLSDFSEQELASPGSADEDFFGEGMAANGQIIAIGAPLQLFAGRRGIVELYSSSTLEHLKTLQIPSWFNAGWNFGSALALKNDLLVIPTSTALFGFDVSNQKEVWRTLRNTSATEIESIEVLITGELIVASFSGETSSHLEVYDLQGNYLTRIDGGPNENALGAFPFEAGFQLISQPLLNEVAPSMVSYPHFQTPTYPDWYESHGPTDFPSQSFEAKRKFLERDGEEVLLSMDVGGALRFRVPNETPHPFDLNIEWSKDLQNWIPIGRVDPGNKISTDTRFMTEGNALWKIDPSKKDYFRLNIKD